jgi:hypothetical protein
MVQKYASLLVEPLQEQASKTQDGNAVEIDCAMIQLYNV